jgi:hypothetical protein
MLQRRKSPDTVASLPEYDRNRALFSPCFIKVFTIHDPCKSRIRPMQQARLVRQIKALYVQPQKEIHWDLDFTCTNQRANAQPRI